VAHHSPGPSSLPQDTQYKHLVAQPLDLSKHNKALTSRSVSAGQRELSRRGLTRGQYHRLSILLRLSSIHTSRSTDYRFRYSSLPTVFQFISTQFPDPSSLIPRWNLSSSYFQPRSSPCSSSSGSRLDASRLNCVRPVLYTKNNNKNNPFCSTFTESPHYSLYHTSVAHLSLRKNTHDGCTWPTTNLWRKASDPLRSPAGPAGQHVTSGQTIFPRDECPDVLLRGAAATGAALGGGVQGRRKHPVFRAPDPSESW